MSSDVNKVLKLNVKNKSVCMAYCKLHRVSSIFFAETSHTFPTYQCLQKGGSGFFSIAVQRALFDFGFKKLFNKRLASPPLYRDFYRLLIASSKDQWVPRMLFVL